MRDKTKSFLSDVMYPITKLIFQAAHAPFTHHGNDKSRRKFRMQT
jgi:hypothetical protein